jgi:manganese/iron transport system substrate-binding protein
MSAQKSHGRLGLAAILLGIMLVLAACGRNEPPQGNNAAGTGAASEVAAEADAHDDHAGEADDAHVTHAEDLTAAELAGGAKLQVVATTNIIADVVARVGGDAVALTALVPNGADPHSYQAKPDDLRTLDDAQVLFVNGLGLEEALASILTSLENTAVVSVNEEITPRALEKEEHADDESTHEGETDHAHGGLDPHTWMDVANVRLWTDTVETALRALDPANADTYAANAAAYRTELDALDVEIRELLAGIPAERRKLVTDHDSYGYFADAYDFTVIGSVIPALSTLATPSAQQLAALQDQLRTEAVPAIFVDSTVNPQLAERLAADLGIQVVPVYAGSLSPADGPAATYAELMRFNAAALAGALGTE